MAGFLLAAAAMVIGVELADRAVLISVISLGSLVHGSFDRVVVFAVLETLIGGPLATLALLRAIAADGALIAGDITPPSVPSATAPRPRWRMHC
jgi:hypothetical protein